MDTEILGINPGSLKSHENYVRDLQLNFKLLSDSQCTMTRAYNALKEDGKSVQRTVYIIDKTGKIRYAKQGMPSDQELLETLKSLG